MQTLKSFIMIPEPVRDAQTIDNRLENILKKKKLQRNPPYQLEKLASKIADQMQPKKSQDREKKSEDLIAPFSDSCQFSLDSVDPKTKERILQTDFWQYVRENHTEPSQMSFGYSTPENRLVYTSELVAPLSRMLDDMKNIALKIFRLIFKICQDRNRANLPFIKIRKLIEVLMNNSAEIKDECFLQIIKQTRNNPHLDPNTNEWRLMAVLSSYVSPSEYFIHSFLNYMNTIFETEKFEDARIWAMFVLMRVLATNRNTERMVLPLKEELVSIEERRKMKIEVHFLNGSKEIYFIESFSTVESLKEQIIAKYGLGEEHKLNFGILETCKKENKLEETFVDDNVKILDVLSSWTNEYEFQCKKDQVDEFKINFKIYFKIKFNFEPSSIEHEVLNYFECFRFFQQNRFELNFETFKTLLVLKLRILFGEVSEERKMHIFKNFKNVTPKLDRDNLDTVQYNELIAEIYQKYELLKMSNIDCMREFVKVCSALNLYQCELYPVVHFKKDDDQTSKVYELPKQLLLGVKTDQVILLDQDLKTIKTFAYSQILKWGFNPNLFILLIHDSYSDIPVKLSFKTKMGAEIVYRMNTLVDLKLGKTIKQNSVMVNENVTREIYKDKFYKKVNVFKQRFISF